MSTVTDEKLNAAREVLRGATEERHADLVVPERGGMHLGTPAYTRFDQAMIELIKKTLMPASAKDSDLYMLLELSATYRLDPFVREIWAVEMKSKNAAGGKRTVIMVGRDGLLTVARRNPAYRGLRAAVVHEKDEFEVLDKLVKWGRYSTQIRHKALGFGPKARGSIVGAFCEVFREDHTPVYFLANLGEYLKADEFSPWKKQPSVMIDKVAIVNALRMAFSVSGLYIEDEMTGMVFPPDSERPVYLEADYGDDFDPVGAVRLRDLFDAAEELKPGEFNEAKRKLLLTNAAQDEKARAKVMEDLERFIVDAGGTVPAPPDPDEVRARAAAEVETVEDAEVVDDDDQIPFGEPVV